MVTLIPNLVRLVYPSEHTLIRRYTDNWAAVITAISCPKGQPDAVSQQKFSSIVRCYKTQSSAYFSMVNPRHNKDLIKMSIVKIWWVSSFWMGWHRVSSLVYSRIHYCLQFIPSFHWTGQTTMWSNFVYHIFLVDMITISTRHCTPYPWAVSLSDIVIRTLPMTCDRTNPRKQYSKTARTTFYQMKLPALFGIIVRFMIKWKFL